jgi:tetratricopeptide (TPR) repeat protein
MKKIHLILLFFITSFYSTQADTIPAISEANDLYKKGEFEKAIVSYEKIVESGQVASELYFNLGNAYYRTHRIPLAILNYERAKKLKPNDEEINFNLELARARIVDKINNLPEFFLMNWLRKLAHSFSADQWAVISMVSFFITLCFAGLFLFSSRRLIKQLAFWLGILLVIVTFSSFAVSQQQKHKLSVHNDAIIITPAVTIRSSPDETGTELFILHEGSKVRIEDTVGDWLEIRISDGNKGWIKASDMIRI